MVPEDLVPAARDRLVAGPDQAEQDVSQPLRPRHLRGASQVEATRTVVQQRRIGRPQRRRDRRVRLVSRGPDRVEPVALGPQIPRHQIEVPGTRASSRTRARVVV